MVMLISIEPMLLVLALAYVVIDRANVIGLALAYVVIDRANVIGLAIALTLLTFSDTHS